MIDPDLRSVCKDAVRSVDWRKIHGLQDPGWGPDGPDWNTWDNSYGTKDFDHVISLDHVMYRTRRWDCELLPRKSDNPNFTVQTDSLTE